MRPIHSLSVLMPTWQGMEFLERVLDSLAAQDTGLPWDLHVVDSGSSDGTLECLESRRDTLPVPLHVHTIPSAEFDHGDTRNLLAARSRGELLVYLTQDAIPSRPDWLRQLARNFEDPEVGAATCRNVPRQDARPLTKVFCRSDPGYGEERIEVRMPPPATLAAMDADERRLLYNFNDVASAIRRELWERHPFPRTMMGEDVLMARGIVHGGYTVVHEVEATVDHSHDYGPDKMRWRGGVDGKFNAEFLDRICVGSEEDAELLTERLVLEDREVLEEQGRSPAEVERMLLEARELRGALVRGLFEGGLSPLRYPPTAMRETGRVGVVFVIDGTSLGQGHELWRARVEGLHARGHRVAVLALDPRPGVGMPLDREPRFERDDRSGWTLVRASWPGDGATLAAAFAGWVAGEGPDVVHVHELSGVTLELLRVARRARAATVLDLRGALALQLDDPETGAAVALADLCLSADAELRAAWIERLDLDPQGFAFREEGGGEGAKTVEQEVAELEFRYRALANITAAAWSEEAVLDEPGSAARTGGETVPQGPDWLLLRPGSWAEFGLSRARPGPVVLEVEQYVLGAEAEVVLSGSVRIDGLEVGTLVEQGQGEQDRVIRQVVEFELEPNASRLRLEPRSGEGRAHLRLCRVSLRPRPRMEDSRPEPVPADLGLLAERLRVEPGPAPRSEDLPGVTIIVPTLEGGEVLGECLASIAELDYPQVKLEVIVVDNGSADGSVAAAAAAHDGVRVVRNGRNLGFAAACNGGARVARSEVLVFLNDDMRFEADLVLELVGPLVRGECAASTAKILGWDGTTIDTSGTGSTFLGIAIQPGYGSSPGPEHDVPRRTLFPCGAAMAIQTEVYREVGGFDEEYFAYYEDLDLGWRLWVLGYEVHYVPRALCYHHHSHTSRRFPPEVVRVVMIRNSLYTCIKNYDDAHLAKVLPALLALAVRRGFLESDLDSEAFRIESAGLLEGEVAGEVPIGRLGAADWIAINDLLGNWSHWMDRRRDVQTRRRRTDEEIQQLFLEPLACVVGESSYAELQGELVRFFGLDRIFGRA